MKISTQHLWIIIANARIFAIGKYIYITIIAGVAQLVERQPSKLNVASSNLVSRSFTSRCSSGVERFLGKEEVTSSNLVIGSFVV